LSLPGFQWFSTSIRGIKYPNNLFEAEDSIKIKIKQSLFYKLKLNLDKIINYIKLLF